MESDRRLNVNKGVKKKHFAKSMLLYLKMKSGLTYDAVSWRQPCQLPSRQQQL